MSRVTSIASSQLTRVLRGAIHWTVVLLTAVTLVPGVTTWIGLPIRFQADVSMPLVFM